MYLHGCNYPWSTDGTTVFYGMDFGANVWGSHLGVSTRRAAIGRDFAEMAALPLIHSAWITAALGTLLHLLVLRNRVTLEESVMQQDADWQAAFGSRPRFLP